MPGMSAAPSPLERLLILYARHFPVDRGKLRVIDASWRAAAGGRRTQRLATLRHGGFRMPCDIREMLQRQFYFFGTYFLERAVLDCWQQEARRADIVFDVGANAGIFSLAAIAVRPGLTVHAFEPTPEIAARLRETAAINALQHLHVHDVAVADGNGHASLMRWRGELDSNEGMNYILPGPGPEPVVTVSLDSFCEANSIERIDMLKLDIQGQEPLALEGATRLLEAGRIGTIFTELNWAREPHVTCPATSVLQMLEALGYEFSEPRLPLRFKKSGEWMRALRDMVARRPSSGRAR